MDAVVVGDVVAVVAQGRGVERQEPEAGDPQVLEIVELPDQAGEVADAVVVAVGERLDVELVDDGVFVPERVGAGSWRLSFPAEATSTSSASERDHADSIVGTGTAAQRGTGGAARPTLVFPPATSSPVSSFSQGRSGSIEGRPLPPSPEPDRKPRRDGNAAAAPLAAGEGDDVVPLRARRLQRRVVAARRRTTRAGAGGGGVPGGSGGAWASPRPTGGRSPRATHRPVRRAAAAASRNRPAGGYRGRPG